MTKQSPKQNLQDPQDKWEAGTWNPKAEAEAKRIIGRIGKVERPAYRGGREYELLPEDSA